jgi:NHL repeat-containing protein/IPT/TIG domain-containing protein
MKFAGAFYAALAFCAGAHGQVISTVAGTGEPGFSGDGGPAIHAQFSDPRHLAVDAAGNVYVVDTNNARVRKISPDGRVVTVAGTGEAAEPTKGAAVRSGFLGIGGLAVTDNGTLYIADATGLQKVDPSGVLSFVVTGQSVQGVALAGSSTVYLIGVTDVSLLGANGAGKLIAGSDLGDAGDGGPAARAKFYASQAAVDPAGNVYVADKEAHRVRKFAPRGAISTLAGNGKAGFGGDGGPASQAQLNRPESIAIDVAGNVYIADTENFRVRQVATDGVITTIAGSGKNDHGGDGGPAAQASLGSVFDVAVGCAGVYITDIESVRKIALTAPLIAFNGVLDTAGRTSIAAGQPFSISGCNLAEASAIADRDQPLPQTLGRASVTVNGVPATLSSVAATRIMGVVPAGMAPGSAKVIVSVNGRSSAPLVVPMK